MEYFVDQDSIVREIWGKGDTILFVFAGASAEFALNKAVDWLYYTGRLPSDPLGRLFSTVSYARQIVFSEKQSAIKAIHRINSIHGSLETERGKNIPEWAYRDVLFMLIDYSIRSFEILERKLKASEKEEVFEVFSRLGKHMNIKDLPENFEEFVKHRQSHLREDLNYGNYTKDLYQQYRKHLGEFRYRLLLEAQKLIAPPLVCEYLKLKKHSILNFLIPVYKISRGLKIDKLIKLLILPSAYKAEIESLDRHEA
ncbi:oxygenase MpaB family protein [Psychroflexus sediminis]|uniref:ER-bound oxygenase mpaB/mpaB'/Rubber oxygenase catalytic domain-containing protein n=1 Tax=Psychroflexus sediminis TaxID=470826 RepID=A0A1G7VAL2_9FLAO|nr:oxygenase MpaB family protein [Psychroflexus sediminis]SDG56836.1 hypothetical protein SAMN04488027_103196 [Psychroflexus sediminis]